MKRVLAIGVFVGLLMLLTLGTVSAQTEYFIRNIIPDPAPGTCSRNDYIATGTGEASLPGLVPIQFTLEEYVNGTLVFTQSLSRSLPADVTGTETIVLARQVPSLDVDLPYTVLQRVRYSAPGLLDFTVTLTGNCAVDGAFTFTGASTSDGSGTADAAAPAINDGRINPQAYAPVALYCDGAQLNVYGISAGGLGYEAFSYDFAQPAAPGNPVIVTDATITITLPDGTQTTLTGDYQISALAAEGDTLLASGAEAALYLSQSGRYYVAAPQLDGKRYIFVFDGCPNPGSTETYISDPATGENVRAE